MSQLSVDSQDRPHVIWLKEVDSPQQYNLYYAFYDGAEWTSYGGGNTGSGITREGTIMSEEPRLALDSQDFPHLSWVLRDFEYHYHAENIYYSYWDGTQWSTYHDGNKGGGVSNSFYTSKTMPNHRSFNPSLAVHQGLPYVAWRERIADEVEGECFEDDFCYKIYLKQWNPMD